MALWLPSPAPAEPGGLTEAYQSASVLAQRQTVQTKAAACPTVGADGAIWGVESSACVMTTPPPGFDRFLKDSFAPFGETPPLSYDVYDYEYRVTNHGDAEIQLDFASHNLAMSPFVDLARGFQLVIPPHKTRVIGFAAINRPKRIKVPVYLGVRGGSGRFSYDQGDAASLECPDWFAAYVVLRDGLEPAQ